MLQRTCAMAGWTVVVVGVVVALLVSGSAAQEWDDEFAEAPTVRSLNDKTFEHETQAATGQTTGSWLVLFISSGCLTCGDVESSLLQIIPKLNGGMPIVAKVNVSENSWTAKRFNVTKIPHLRLFRDRHMFSYGGGKWSAANILSFIEDGWKGVDSEVVPKELTYVDELQQKLHAFYKAVVEYLGNKPGILASVGSIMAMAGYMLTKKFLMKKPKPRRPHGRLRKRAD